MPPFMYQRYVQKRALYWCYNSRKYPNCLFAVKGDVAWGHQIKNAQS